MRQANAAFGSGDLGALQSQFLAEDVVWHVPGRGPLAGDYQGIAEVIALFGKISRVPGGRHVSRCTTFSLTAIT